MADKVLHIKTSRWVDGALDRVSDARARHKEKFPGRSARRMTHLGMLTDLCIRDLDIDEELPLIYTSAFAESGSLEDFIDSFPHPSPMGFQTSIHPSAVEQSLILRKHPVGRFYPITSGRNLAGKALENALLLGEDRLALIGGEEKGDWLTPFGLASDLSFAFALEFYREAEGESLGAIRFEPADDLDGESAVELPELYAAVRDCSALRVPSFALGGWIALDWS